MIKRFITIISMLLCLSVIFYGCGLNGGTENTTTQSTDNTTSASETETSAQTATEAELSDEYYHFTDNDLDSSFDRSSATKISFTDSGASVSGKGATADGGNVTITEEGVYIISGSSQSGSITVNTAKDVKLKMVLDGLTLTNPDGPALYIKQTDKCFITLSDGSINTLSDGTTVATEDEKELDGCIFSRCDMAINGSGTLTVNGNAAHGIVSKDDLIIAGGNITVNSVKTAVNGKDCVKLAECNLTVNAGTDGIRATNDEDTTLGYVFIASGSYNVTAGNDGIQAAGVIDITGGDFNITTGGGSVNASSDSNGNDNGFWGFGGYNGNNSADNDSESAKGIKSVTLVLIKGGTFTLDTADDSIHSNGDAEISGCTINAASGDDGIHADTNVTISGGTIEITKSYEGIEGSVINITGGDIDITASDDGLNGAGGADSSAMGGRPGMGGFSSGTGTINIGGGYTVVDARGDGIDSNGDINMTGGIVLVSGPSDSANAAFDYDGNATVTGGTLIAVGASGMAQNFSSAENQCAMLTSFTSQGEGTTIAVTDENGNVICSYTAARSFNSATITSPAFESGKTYSVICGATVTGADENGYTDSGTAEGGTTVSTVTFSGTIYSEGGFGGMGGGMGGPGNMGGPARP